MNALLINCSFKKHLFLSWCSLTFQLKANDRVLTNLEYNGYMMMKDMSLKKKDSMYNTHLDIWSFSRGKKCALYTDNTVRPCLSLQLKKQKERNTERVRANNDISKAEVDKRGR